ncbi:Peptide/h+ symporter protein [Mycena indigotica]|uniref:Peptide/h+ symporter protein n=1 Tax=Mycena indigotica TaxID=2126181 RepID=A0A8H6S1U7_9AGAR|nr:Peptide/h+ symporter protein [Mycena indigotica]KAF7289765.1 Peptide/h+ symporter protein [Mycena indigotica]
MAAVEKKADSVDEKVLESGSDIVQGDLTTTHYVENSEGVTEEELATLRHVRDKMPWTAFLIAAVEFAERWTYYGTTNLYGNYIRAKLPPGSRDGHVLPANRGVGVAGALGQGQERAFAIRTFNSFFVYVTPFLGAIIADTKWGRYKTISVFSIVIFLGHIILVGSATPDSLAKPNTALGLLILSIFVMAIGAGSIKSNVSPMIAEQYQGKLRKETLPSGETVIISPGITIQSIYLYFYMAINFGSTGAISASFLARDHGYWVAFLVPTCIFATVPAILWIGRKNYVKTPPRGSIIIETFRVIRVCVGARWSWNPVAFYKEVKREGFWDPAKPSTYNGKAPEYITWDDDFVGEVHRTMLACKVFVFFPIFWLCYSQIDGNLGTVAAGMTLKGTPNDLIQNLNPISIIIMVPIFERVIYPLLRRWGINFSPIKRIAMGFFVAGLAMVWAAVLEHYLYKTSPCPNHLPSECETADGNPNAAPINVWVVSGPYILVGMAEIFASITSLEYAYTKAPQRMKSVVMAFAQLQTAIASALNFALTSVNVEDKFQWLFASFGITATIFAGIFYFTFRELDRAELELNMIGTGGRSGFAGEAEGEGRPEKGT